MRKPSRRARIGTLIAATLATGFTIGAFAQTIDVRQWQGVTAVARQPEQVFVTTQAEWRSLWSRVGLAPPDHFEPSRTNAVGIFLGPRAEGASVNVISTSRRRDRIVVVFEERVPPGSSNSAAAQRPASRTISSGPPPMAGAGGASFAPGNAPPAPPPAMASRALPGPTSSPWAIVLINRSDLPVSVEQRLFR